MHPASASFIGQMLRPTPPSSGRAAPPAPAAMQPITLEQIAFPRGPGALVSQATVRVDDVAIVPPAAV